MKHVVRRLSLLVPLVLVGPLVSGAPLAAGKPKFLGGVHSTAQAVGLTDYWNQVTPENAGKWGSVEGTRDVMNWGQLDAAYATAKNNGLTFRFHILIWGNQQPAWIASLPPAEQLEEIQEWYAAVAARYPDIDYLEVVNEPISDAPDGLPGRFDPAGSVDPNDGNYIAALGGAGTTGWDWVLNAFRLAREAFPNTPLVMHDYSLVNNTTTLNRFLEIVNLLKAEGLIDIIGEQAHSFTIANMQATTLRNNLDLMAAVGLPIMMTELDIDGADSTTVNDTLQLDRYQRLFPVMWEHPAVMGITTWGYRPGMWRANAVLVLSGGVERSAMTWLRSYVADSNPPLRPSFTRSPRSITRNAGETAIFSARVLGNPAPTLRWQVSTDGGGFWTDLADGGGVSGSGTPTLTLATPTAAMNGFRYRLSATNASGTFTTPYAAALTVVDVPFITGQPENATTVAGTPTVFTVGAEGSGIAYQWMRDGVDIAGANASSYRIPSTQSFHAGAYSVRITNTNGIVTSNSATLTVTPAPASTARVMNLSTRGGVLTGDRVLIPGFVIQGTGTKRMLLRGVGPGMWDYHELPGYLPDSVMYLTQQADGALIANNDDWGTNTNAAQIATTSDQVGAFPLLNGSKDAVLLLDLPAGRYTAATAGVGDATGIAMVELYDADETPTAQLVNLSTRGFVGVGGSIMIPGFVLSSEGSRTFLIRAVGRGMHDTFPELFSPDDVLPDPILTVYSGSTAILTVDDWDVGSGVATTTAVTDQVGAFTLLAGSKDAAFVVTLPPGGYTVHASGKDGTTGIAMVELYLVP